MIQTQTGRMDHRIVSVSWATGPRYFDDTIYWELQYICDCGRRDRYYIYTSRDNYDFTRRFIRHRCRRGQIGCVGDVLIGTEPSVTLDRVNRLYQGDYSLRLI
jgi:hypothetical protein